MEFIDPMVCDNTTIKRILVAQSIQHISDILEEWRQNEFKINMEFRKNQPQERIDEYVDWFKSQPKALSHLLDKHCQ